MDSTIYFEVLVFVTAGDLCNACVEILQWTQAFRAGERFRRHSSDGFLHQADGDVNVLLEFPCKEAGDGRDAASTPADSRRRHDFPGTPGNLDATIGCPLARHEETDLGIIRVLDFYGRVSSSCFHIALRHQTVERAHRLGDAEVPSCRNDPGRQSLSVPKVNTDTLNPDVPKRRFSISGSSAPPRAARHPNRRSIASAWRQASYFPRSRASLR
jgi:hypothetical protein